MKNVMLLILMLATISVNAQQNSAHYFNYPVGTKFTTTINNAGAQQNNVATIVEVNDNILKYETVTDLTNNTKAHAIGIVKSEGNRILYSLALNNYTPETGSDLWVDYPIGPNVGDTYKNLHFKGITEEDGKTVKINMKYFDRKVVGKDMINTSAGSFDCYLLTYQIENVVGGLKIMLYVKNWISDKAGIVKSETYRKNKIVSTSLLNKIEDKNGNALISEASKGETNTSNYDNPYSNTSVQNNPYSNSTTTIPNSRVLSYKLFAGYSYAWLGGFKKAMGDDFSQTFKPLTLQAGIGATYAFSDFVGLESGISYLWNAGADYYSYGDGYSIDGDLALDYVVIPILLKLDVLGSLKTKGGSSAGIAAGFKYGLNTKAEGYVSIDVYDGYSNDSFDYFDYSDNANNITSFSIGLFGTSDWFKNIGGGVELNFGLNETIENKVLYKSVWVAQNGFIKEKSNLPVRM